MPAPELQIGSRVTTSTRHWTFLPISTNRRQTFSRNETALSTSASLGSSSSGSPGQAILLAFC
jgi:hypothetical protein